MIMWNKLNCKNVILGENASALNHRREIKDYFVNSTYSLILLLFFKNIPIFLILFFKLNNGLCEEVILSTIPFKNYRGLIFPCKKIESKGESK